jgi:hypothetical protein
MVANFSTCCQQEPRYTSSLDVGHKQQLVQLGIKDAAELAACFDEFANVHALVGQQRLCHSLNIACIAAFTHMEDGALRQAVAHFLDEHEETDC